MNTKKIVSNSIAFTSSFFSILALYGAFCCYYRDFIDIGNYPSFKLYGTIIFVITLFTNLFTGINHGFLYRTVYKEISKVFIIVCVIITGIILLLFWFHILTDSKRLIFCYFAVIFFFTDLAVRLLIRDFVLKVFNKSKFSSKVLVVAEGAKVRSVVRLLDKTFVWSKSIVGICLEDGAKKDQKIRNKKAVCSYSELLSYVTKNGVDEIIISLNDENLSKIKGDLSQIEEMGVRVSFTINLELFDYLPSSFIRYEKYGPLQFICVSRHYLSYRKIFAKIFLDYLGGFVGIIIFGIAYLIMAPIIKLDSKGPVLFKQPRVGRNGRIFNCYKFRSMVTDAEELKKKLMSQNEMSGLMFKMENDPRITKVGRFIRKTSIDELPQFINVLKGDMSLVGTRPPTLDEYSRYEPKHKARVSMSPGLTGLWQVSGRSDIKNFDEVVALDMQYIDNWSIWLDIKIILKTVLMVLVGSGAK
ncbi:MAG: sugar transferase [Succinivibrio sp.]